MLAASKPCDTCKLPVSLDRTQCPHCGKPHLFPNVRLAEQDEHRNKLLAHYHEAHENCQKRGCENVFAEFEKACTAATAVFNCPLLRLHRAIASGTDVIETYHDLERLRIRTERPKGHDWQKLRPQAEIELLGSAQHLDKLHYAVLTLDGIGAVSYGDCTVQLRDEMIRHRASCFEGNSGLIFAKRRSFSGCLRSLWDERSRLCVAKHARDLDKSTHPETFASVLLSQGTTKEQDEFIEVHVFGPMTAHTFQSVSIRQSGLSRIEKTLWKAVKEKLAKAGVTPLET